MKFSKSTTIDKPIAEVVKLWKDQDNLKEWQDGFQKADLLEGEQHQKGAVSMLYFAQGKSTMELKETILENNLPASFKGLYEHEHMVNTMTSRFEETTDGKTRYTAEVEYTKFIGFMPWLMSKLVPFVFKKQVQKWLDQFKVFAEGTSE